MESILDILAKADMDIELLFKDYTRKKEKENLYSKDDHIPQNLIKLYYLDNNHLSFKKMIDEFKKKAIYNENELEHIHDINEREGLEVVYDKIEEGYFSIINNIHVILIIHQNLYSKMPYSNYGGKYRNINAYITNTDIPTTDYNKVPKEVQNLNEVYEEIETLSKLINESESPNLLIKYIDKCVYLKCKLIKIHPFTDGNGRTCRALVNLLFKKVNLPPIYINSKERQDYLKAMNLAVTEEDYSSINKFYYYKICDSIYELDIVNRNNTENKTK